jgi:hypothetical protein
VNQASPTLHESIETPGGKQNADQCEDWAMVNSIS